MTKIKKFLYFSDRKRYYKNQKARVRYHEKKITEEIFYEEPKIKVPKIKVPKVKRRIRQQVVYNTGYSISLRAIVINGNLTLEDLEEALQTYISANEGLDNLDFDTTGLEEEEIDIKEDAGLQEGLIYVELNVKGNTTLTNL